MTNRDKAISETYKAVNAVVPPQKEKGKDIPYNGTIHRQEKDPIKAVRLFMTSNGLSLKRAVELERIIVKYTDNIPELKKQVNRVLNMKFFADTVEKDERVEKIVKQPSTIVL